MYSIQIQYTGPEIQNLDQMYRYTHYYIHKTYFKSESNHCKKSIKFIGHINILILHKLGINVVPMLYFSLCILVMSYQDFSHHSLNVTSSRDSHTTTYSQYLKETSSGV